MKIKIILSDNMKEEPIDVKLGAFGTIIIGVEGIQVNTRELIEHISPYEIKSIEFIQD